jgi:NADH-quinone oxidoreductase subunit F
MGQVKILSEHFDDPAYATLKGYKKKGGYQAWQKALEEMDREAIIEEVKKANLRGLGGAGFPAGVKWNFMPKESDPERPNTLVVNADEGEPGTIKDKYCMVRAPHQLIEGICIAAKGVGAHLAFIYVRGEYVESYRCLEKAIAEAKKANLVGKDILGSGYDLEIVLFRGAGAYICGEETALLTSLEGGKGNPKLKPPFPAQRGAFGWPSNVNNVETLSHVPHIISKGAEWFAGVGCDRNGGTRLFGVSGHVEKPGVYEFPMGTPCREILEEAGGVRGGKRLKAFIPGGSSAQVLTADDLDVAMDFDSLAAAGSMGGSGGIVVMDEDTCMVKALHIIARFYAHESCGQCSPCREGTGWASRILTRILEGRGNPQDVDTLKSVADNFCWRTICAFAPGAAFPIQSFVTKFRDEFDYHALHGRCDLDAAEEGAA